MTSEELEARFFREATDLGVTVEHQYKILTLLAPLKGGPLGVQEHYKHSLRVGHLAAQVGTVTFNDARALFMAGTVHDVGKVMIPENVLAKTSDWTEADALVMQEHVMAGYEILKGIFDFSAEIMLWHHKFQKDGYPDRLPPLLHNYSVSTELAIVTHGRMLALADVYDALHRSNDKFGGRLSGSRIRELMFQFNPDKETLVTHLYEEGVFVV